MVEDNLYCTVLFYTNHQVMTLRQIEIVQYKETNESVMKTIIFLLELDNQKEFDFNGETMTFTLQLSKI